MSTPKFVLGTPTEEFSKKTLRKLLYSAKTPKQTIKAKIYLCSYFALAEVGVYKWMPSKKSFKYFNENDAKTRFIQGDTVNFTDNKGKYLDCFSIQSMVLSRDSILFSRS